MNDPRTEAGPFRVLFVCTGNTCRSPMAEVIARRRLADRGWTQVEVRSAGVGAFEGSPVSGGALRTAVRHGLDLSGHEATYLTREVADAADLILTMSASHLARVRELGAGERAAIITSFAAVDGEEGVAAGVPDPIGGPDEEYAHTFDVLAALIERALERLEPVVKP
jgi:protein-tyrosine-phosphatase